MSEILLFDHIPKTAGSTMRHVLYRVFGGPRVFLLTELGHHRERAEELCRLLEEPRPQVRAIVSHAGWGMHERLPPQHRYRRFTILRDPVQRTLSNYYFQIQEGAVPQSMPFAEWLERPESPSYNAQTAFLAGPHIRKHIDGRKWRREELTPEVLEQAKRNLESYDAVGLTEQFEPSLLLLRHTYRWPLASVLHRRVNVGRLRPPRRALPVDDLEAARACNRLDIELYEHATLLFQRQLARAGIAQSRKVAGFRRVNSLYIRTYPVFHPPARALVHSLRHQRTDGAGRGATERPER